ncbi:MAG: hypothetical protein HC837_11025 [Chloroflexaceae bacterium]|nr:hypothetical protein [Chloroflexaceae bacterium]
MILSDILFLLFLALIAVLLAGALAPFESLGWWAGWYDATAPEDADATSQDAVDRARAATADHYIVYLSGIGDISGDTLTQGEIVFLDELAQRMPDTVIIRDIFPYSMHDKGLSGQGFFAGLWDWVQKSKIRGNELPALMVNIRNMFQVGVSADPRYGPIYNQGSSELILRGLLRHGYPLGSGKPVTLIGYSGGGQISIGAVTFLKHMINAPIQVISIGGVMSSDRGIQYLEHLYHLYGDKDVVQKLGAIMYSSRWSIMPKSSWNTATKEGRISQISLGPIDHNGAVGYFGTERYLANGQSHVEKSIEATFDVLVHSGFTRVLARDVPTGSLPYQSP